MRLLVVSQVFWPEPFRVNDLVAELVGRGHDVTVLTGIPNYPDGYPYPAFRKDPRRFDGYHGARIVRVPIITRGRTRLRLVLNYVSFVVSATLLGAWKLRGCSFDAIFVYQPSPITSALPALLLRKLKSAPVAMWVLDLWPETLEAIGVVRRASLLKLVGALVSFIYKRCDLILAQSRGFIPSISRYCAQAKRIEYFPSWAEDMFVDAPVPPAGEIAPAPGSFSIMFAGNIGEAQDFPAVLRAAVLLRDHANIRWLVVGDGRMAEWVRAEITRLGLGDRVFMLGRHPVERMPAFYRHADALLVSLKDEPIFALTIPGKLQSYLAAGIPILAMLCGEGANAVETAGAGLTCRAGDASGLAAAVLKLVATEPAEREKMGSNGRAYSAEQFDRAALITRLENWLSRLRIPGSGAGG